MVSSPVLALSDFQKTFVIESDASGYRLGVVLMQDKQQLSSGGWEAMVENEIDDSPLHEASLSSILLALTVPTIIQLHDL